MLLRVSCLKLSIFSLPSMSQKPKPAQARNIDLKVDGTLAILRWFQPEAKGIFLAMM